MNEPKRNKNNTFDNIIINKHSSLNEIKLIRRTLENNTHEVYEDSRIKKITSWRKSQNKFFHNLIYNILSFGILHLLSLYYPKLYVKLYCNPWPVKESDFFLVENIYNEAFLCPIIKRRDKRNVNNFSDINENDSTDGNNIEQKYSFEYKSIKYEYNRINNEINPIYINLSNLTNEKIIGIYSEGLSTKKIVNNLKERYGKNEYNLNIKLYLLFFLKNQIPINALIIIIELVQFIFLKNYLNLFFKFIIITFLIVAQIIIIKIKIINKYKNEFTLDGNEKVRVKRKYLFKEDEQVFSLLDNIDLLPGDIIYFKQNDLVPCDCILIGGECIVNQSDLTGKIDTYKKFALKSNNKYFNYKNSYNNILYHGTRIIKTNTKNNNEYISALCINTGANTIKANQYSNILYFTMRKNNKYSLFNERKRVYLFMIIPFVLTLVLGFFVFDSFIRDKNRSNSKNKLPSYIIGMICKSFMTYYFITKNIIIFIYVLFLNKVDITCFDQLRLLNLGEINKIIFNKTETLSSNNLNIIGYHPVYMNFNKKRQYKFLHFSKEQSKYLNHHLFEYYQNYLDNKNNNSTNSQKIKTKKESIVLFNDFNNNSENQLILFLECLLSCSDVDNNNFELFGNNLDIKLFNDMKWKVKQCEDNNNNSIKIGKNSFNDKYYYIIKKETEIFPYNYYKLTSSSNKGKDKTKDNNKEKKISNINNLNISNSDIGKYKLKIYKKFIFNDSFSSASIIYNYLTNDLRFMIKGIPEVIINKCDKKTIPYDLQRTISLYRSKGFIILICATKLLKEYESIDENDLEYYMDDLLFCGILTLENKVNDNVKNSINEIKKFNNNLLIISGDNEYNCLSTGYNSGIIDNKDIFVLDLDEKNNNRITINKIYSKYIDNNEENENETDISKLSKISKINKFSRILTNLGQKDSDDKIRDDTIVKNNNIFQKTKVVNLNENILENNISLSELKNNTGKNNLFQKSRIRKNIKMNNINENSEMERIIKVKSKYDESINKESFDKNIYNENIDNISKNIDDHNKNPSMNNNLIFMQKYYFQTTFNEYEDVKNGIFCTSGKLFDFLYENKNRKGVKKFLDEIIEKSKIFYNMSSIDKSNLVNYYRESPTNIICTIGQCDSDIDSIISSNIGITLKNPNNKNTILSHFYSSKNDIICIKEIMEYGRLLYEKILMLEFISFNSSIVFNSFIIGCFLRDYDIISKELDFLEIEFCLLIILSFLGSFNKDNIHLMKNSKKLTIYYTILTLEILFIKLFVLYVFMELYRGDRTLDPKSLSAEFISNYFVICNEFILIIILTYNFSSFYNDSLIENQIFISLSLLYFGYIFSLIFLCSSNIYVDIFNITYFAQTEKLMDSYTDRNKAYLLLFISIDAFASGIICFITKVIFSKFNN